MPEPVNLLYYTQHNSNTLCHKENLFMNYLLPVLKTIRIIPVFALILFTAAGCAKEPSGNLTCAEFRQALIVENEAVVGQEVNAQIAALRSKMHTLQNIRELATRFTDQGCTPVGTYCFSCVYTNPPVSELFVSFSENGTAITKTLLITENARGEMVFRGLHP